MTDKPVDSGTKEVRASSLNAEAAESLSSRNTGKTGNALLDMSESTGGSCKVEEPAKNGLTAGDLASIGSAIACGMPSLWALGKVAKVYTDSYMTAATLGKLEEKAKSAPPKPDSSKTETEQQQDKAKTPVNTQMRPAGGTAAENRTGTQTSPGAGSEVGACAAPQSLELRDLQWAIDEAERERDGKGGLLDGLRQQPTCLSGNDEKFLQMVVGDRDSTRRADAVRSDDGFCNMDLTNEDWLTIGNLMKGDPNSGLEAFPSAVIGDGRSPSEIKTDGDKITVTDQDNGIRTVKEGTGTVTTLGNGGEIRTDGQTTTYDTPDGVRQVTVDKDGPDTYRLTENRFAKKVGDVVEIYDASGERIGRVTKREYYRRERDYDIFMLRDAKTAEDALEAWRRNKGLLQEGATSILFRDNGASIVDNDKTTINFDVTDKGVRYSMRIDDKRQLVQDEQGKHFIKEEGKPDIELSEEQVDEIFKPMGRKRAFFEQVMEALKSGRMTLGQTVVTMSRSGDGAPSSDSAGPGKTYEIENTGTHDRETFDTDTGKLSLARGDETPAVIDPDRTFNITTSAYRVENDQVIIPGQGEGQDVRIEDNGTVFLPNGTTITTGGRISLSDGTTITESGAIIDGNGKTIHEAGGSEAMTRTMDSYVSFAQSLASSVAARACSGGTVSLSDIAMINANMSILANFMVFLSNAGDLEAVQSVRNSWGLLKDSLDRAEQNLRDKNTRLRLAGHQASAA
ncbi:MAG: hypothetical protein AB7W16_04530 [Candidatus Obscuribacterales bacterium]